MPKYKYTCKRCGIPFEAPLRVGGIHRQYCSDYCSKQSRRLYSDAKCQTCGTIFAPRKGKSFSFCSESCYKISKIKYKKCLKCNKQFQQRKTQRFCSKSCAYQWRKENSNAYTVRICLNCKKEFKVSVLQIKYRDGGKYCSNKCRVEYCIGENHPRWKPDKEIYDPGPNWHLQRKEVIKRDNGQCQNCKKSHKDRVKIDVHHIIKCRLFNGDYEKANDLSNLITLCRDCHLKIEHNKIPCPLPIVERQRAIYQSLLT